MIIQIIVSRNFNKFVPMSITYTFTNNKFTLKVPPIYLRVH